MTSAVDDAAISRRLKQSLFQVIFSSDRSRCRAVRNAAGWVGNWTSDRVEYQRTTHALIEALVGYAYDHRERLRDELRMTGYARQGNESATDLSSSGQVADAERLPM